MLAAMRWCAIATVLAVTRIAVAEPAATEASAIFQQGRDLARQGRFAEACQLFAKSYELDPALGTAVNLADCLERQGHVRRAWELFDVVARNSQSVQSRARLARQRADALAARFATVVVTVRGTPPPGLAVRIGERELPLAAIRDTEVREMEVREMEVREMEVREMIEPRDVEVVATAPGRPTFRTVLHATAGSTVTVEIPAFGDDEPPATRRRRSRVYLAGGLATAGVAGLGVSLGLAISAKRTYDGAFLDDCVHLGSDVTCRNARGTATIERAGRRADLATGFAIAGGVLAGAAAAVFLTAPTETVGIAPIASPHALGLGVVGRF
jgi:hypothetical protein